MGNEESTIVGSEVVPDMICVEEDLRPIDQTSESEMEGVNGVSETLDVDRSNQQVVAPSIIANQASRPLRKAAVPVDHNTTSSGDSSNEEDDRSSEHTKGDDGGAMEESLVPIERTIDQLIASSNQPMLANITPGAVNVSAGYVVPSRKRKASARHKKKAKRSRPGNPGADHSDKTDGQITQHDLSILDGDIKSLIDQQCEARIKENVRAALTEAGLYTSTSLDHANEPQHDWPALPRKEYFQDLRSSEQADVLNGYADSLKVHVATIKAQAIPVNKVFELLDYMNIHMTTVDDNMYDASTNVDEVLQAHAAIREDLETIDEKLTTLSGLRANVARIEDTMRVLESGPLDSVKEMTNDGVTWG